MLTLFSRHLKRFNQDLNNWDVSSVTNMDGMFDEALTFNQKLCWDVPTKSTNKIFNESPACIQQSCCPDCNDYSLFFSNPISTCAANCVKELCA